MTRPRHDPDAGPGEPADPRVARLLRWYPATWRERYEDEFLAMVEDTLDGRRPGWRLRLGVAWSGLRERGRLLSGPAGKQALSQWPTFVMTGSLLAGFVGDTTHPSAAGTWQAATVLTALAALAAVTGAALVAAVTIAWRPLVTFLRAGGWPKVRRRIIWAVAATAAAAGALTWLAVLQASLTAGQLATSQAYGNVLSGLTVLFVVTTWLWARGAGAVAKHLELELRIQATETLLGAVISISLLTMVPVEVIWTGVIRSSALWLTAGLTLLAASVFTAPGMLRRARRRARRQRAAAARGR
jgi:hypothetical protein